MPNFFNIDIKGINSNTDVISVSGSANISNDYSFTLLLNTSINEPLESDTFSFLWSPLLRTSRKRYNFFKY
jgi:hypothetical protein